MLIKITVNCQKKKKRSRKKAQAHTTCSVQDSESGRITEELENSKTGIALGNVHRIGDGMYK